MGCDYLCVLSALSSSDAGPRYLVDGLDVEIPINETAAAMASEITETVEGGELDFHTIEGFIQESLTLAITLPTSYNFNRWLEDYLGRRRRHGWDGDLVDLENDFFRTAVVIGPEGEEIPLQRAEDYHEDLEQWLTVVIDGENGEEKRVCVARKPVAGIDSGTPFFCWERLYRYFETWMRRYSSLNSLDASEFVRQFYRLVDTDRGHGSDIRATGLPARISYGGIERTHDNWYQDVFVLARTQSTHTAASITAGARGPDLWPALALDFGAWMATRPDLWPPPPSVFHANASYVDFAKPSTLHELPVELHVQILPLLSVQDLLSVLQLSRGVHGLIQPLLDETLWHHVHHGDLGWILPVENVKGEVERANTAARGWYPERSELASVLDSKDFPFSRFVSECSKSNSMRNRRRLWSIYKQYEVLWKAMDFE
ncbi:hypothetical protein DFH06DRAFT_1424523 [Mycena polygramma]|nr:hypothetical protein DFH06DRAFT_1424523 [Mycena polygramma]